MPDKRSSNWGGARKGAGRPKKGLRVVVYLSESVHQCLLEMTPTGTHIFMDDSLISNLNQILNCQKIHLESLDNSR